MSVKFTGIRDHYLIVKSQIIFGDNAQSTLFKRFFRKIVTVKARSSDTYENISGGDLFGIVGNSLYRRPLV